MSESATPHHRSGPLSPAPSRPSESRSGWLPVLLLRPIRTTCWTAATIQRRGGLDQLWPSDRDLVGTLLLTPVFGTLVSRSRERFIPVMYGFSSCPAAFVPAFAPGRIGARTLGIVYSLGRVFNCSWCRCSGASWPTFTTRPVARCSVIALVGTLGPGGPAIARRCRRAAAVFLDRQLIGAIACASRWHVGARIPTGTAPANRDRWHWGLACAWPRLAFPPPMGRANAAERNRGHIAYGSCGLHRQPTGPESRPFYASVV